MLTEVKKHLSLIGRYFRFNLAASMEYRGSFLFQVLGMVLNNAAFAFFWWVVFHRIRVIEGYNFHDVMFIWALASSAYGFAHILFGNIGNIVNVILNGELDTYLLQPKDVYINLLCSRTQISAWGDLAYGYVLLILLNGFQPLQLLLFSGFVIFSGLLMGSVLATAESLTFFIGNASSLFRLAVNFLLTFTTYPEGIFKGGIRWIVYTLLPAGFIVYLPHRIMNRFHPGSLALLFLVDIVYVILGYLIFRWGLRRYESGNLITTKL
jgi:ABC-2 type transport system permease protein